MKNLKILVFSLVALMMSCVPVIDPTPQPEPESTPIVEVPIENPVVPETPIVMYTVTFLDSYHLIDTISIESGKTVSPTIKPCYPRQYYTFAGWRLENKAEFFDFSTPITSNIKLTSHWVENPKYTITYKQDGNVVGTEYDCYTGTERAVRFHPTQKFTYGFKYRWTYNNKVYQYGDIVTVANSNIVLEAKLQVETVNTDYAKHKWHYHTTFTTSPRSTVSPLFMGNTLRFLRGGIPFMSRTLGSGPLYNSYLAPMIVLVSRFIEIDITPEKREFYKHLVMPVTNNYYYEGDNTTLHYFDLPNFKEIYGLKTGDTISVQLTSVLYMNNDGTPATNTQYYSKMIYVPVARPIDFILNVP